MEELYDIVILDSVEGVPFPIDEVGTIYVVGEDGVLSDSIWENVNLFKNGIIKSKSFLDYQVRFVEQPASFKDDYGWNIICPIENPITGTRLYVTAASDDSTMGMAAFDVILKAEETLRRLIEDALVIAAVNNPEDFREAVDIAIDDSNDIVDEPDSEIYWSSRIDDRPDADYDASDSLEEDIISSIESDSMSLPESDMEFDICCADEDDGGSSGFYLGAPLASPISQKKHSVTAKERKTAFKNLPERVSESFMKENTMAAAIVNETLENLTAEECRALIKELGKKHKNLLKGVYDTTLQGITKYELVLHPWDVKYCKLFKNKYRYCLFLRDSKGNEKPVLFKHNPSFCIYVMYMVDRYNRKEDVTDLSIKAMEDKFTSIYKILIDETDEKIRDLFKGMISRTTKTGSLRDGRYGEYIKDIHRTLEAMMDNVTSIPFKVGFGRYLQVPPEKLEMPISLTKFKIV